ncbi:MAG: glycosyltransferase family 4 protein [Acidobacteria bacterium]|nr:glycosyltransferase family 4 protein [Acidobacteriota bacterium]
MTEERINLLVCGHDLKFIKPLIDRCETSGRYNIKIFTYNGHDIWDEAAAKSALDWAHVIFCEWALGNAVWFSQQKRPDQILIVRLHLQEIQSRNRTNYIWEIDWSQVDRLILITHYLYDWVCSNIPAVAPRCALIYNPIPAKGRLNQPKNPESRYVLGMVGIIPARKRMDIAIEILRELLRYSPEYILRIKGALPSEYSWMQQRVDEMNWYRKVFDGLSDLQKINRVVFDPHSPDMEKWYRDIGQVLSVSDFEGSHQAVAEGMASGCVPVIRNWEGASRIYPGRYVRSSIEQMVELIKENSDLDTFRSESEYCRNFAQQQFDELDICSQIESIIHQELGRNSQSKACKSSSVKIRRILPTFLILAYIPIGSRNGYRIRVEQEIRILKRHGCKVHLACMVPPQNYKGDGSIASEHKQELQSLGCDVHFLPVNDIFRMDNDMQPFRPLIAQLVAIAGSANADIVHAEALYCARIASEVKKTMQNITFSIDWHGINPEESTMYGAHENRIKALEEMEKELLGQSDLNIFVSRQMSKHYEDKYGLTHLKHEIVPCCVSDTFLNDNYFTPIDGITEKHLVFGYAGTMANWQCGAEMIQLFSRLYKASPESRFVFLVPKSDQSKLYEYIEHVELPSHCYLVKEVPHHEVPAWLKAFHVGVLLRKNNPVNLVSSPTKYAEYLAAGVPVLVTDCVGDYSEHVKKHNVGLVIPESNFENEGISPACLFEILEMAKNSKSRRFSISRKCREAARELDWEYTIRKWIDAYKPHLSGS